MSVKTDEKRTNGAVKKDSAFFAILLCWIAYITAYVGRYSYSSNIISIQAAFSTDSATTGLVSTCFFFAYGAGQVINGILCKYYKKRYVVSLALVFSAAVNLIFFLGVPFSFMKYLWLINGISQSFLWSSFIYLLSKNLNEAQLARANVLMSTTVPIGTFLAYGCSALFVRFDWRITFLVASIFMIFSAILWFFFFKGAFSFDCEKKTAGEIREKRRIGSEVFTVIATLALLAIANNLVRDGLMTWLPSILKKSFGLPDSLSIILTLVLPMLGVLGTFLNVSLRRRFSSFVTLSGVWFLLSFIALFGVVLLLSTNHWYFLLALLGLISIFMYAVNNVITSMAPLYMRDKINSGMLAGTLDGFCYVGSAISTYGLGAVADRYDWNGVFYLLLLVCLFGVLVSFASSLKRKK
jgi:OPA family glycerol-3-phosphate transporter-like MFS transporter